jgi:AraC-like DNA-binding protein
MSESKLNSSNNTKDCDTVGKKLYVKYMVCMRDKLALKSILDEHGLVYSVSVHGAIEFLEETTKVQIHELRKNLLKSGLVLLDEKESMLIDRIINLIIEVIHYTDELPKISFADFISEYTGSGKESILKIFSDVKGMSVLQFIVIQKIERAKELLIYDELPLPKIAELLNYKNQAYLNAQFKKTTGLTPAYFKRLRKERMKVSLTYNYSSHSGVAKASS